MNKGMGHYSSTSAWAGNVGVCGHNRGAKYVIGDIKNLIREEEKLRRNFCGAEK